MKISRTMDELVRDLTASLPRDERQCDNTARLAGLSGAFYSRLGIDAPLKDSRAPESVILESGHQPNFLPHCGMWKKAFLLSWIQQKITGSGGESAAFFGFADLNLSTAKYLYRNQVPALNTSGSEPVGFKIDEKCRFRSFHTHQKPPAEAWQKEMDRIRRFYLGNARKLADSPPFFQSSLDTLMETLWQSYERAENFAELNAFIFARICHEILGFDLHFFMYSDIQKEKIFLDESIRLLNQLPAYNRVYNRTIEERELKIPEMPAGRMPFWYHCPCGAKVDITISEPWTGQGICPSCKMEHSLEFGKDFKDLGNYYGRMDFTAVSRNLVVSEGTGNALFIPGSGGSLQYGEISDAIAGICSFHQPVVLTWRSTDCYLGPVHAVALKDLMKAGGIERGDMIGPGIANKVTGKVEAISADIARREQANEDKKNIKTMKNTLHNFTNLVESVGKIFSLTPSALDVLVSTDQKKIPDLWRVACEQTAVMTEGRLNHIEGKILYPNVLLPELEPVALPELYRSMRELEAIHDKKNSHH